MHNLPFPSPPTALAQQTSHLPIGQKALDPRRPPFTPLQPPLSRLPSPRRSRRPASAIHVSDQPEERYLQLSSRLLVLVCLVEDKALDQGSGPHQASAPRLQVISLIIGSIMPFHTLSVGLVLQLGHYTPVPPQTGHGKMAPLNTFSGLTLLLATHQMLFHSLLKSTYDPSKWLRCQFHCELSLVCSVQGQYVPKSHRVGWRKGETQRRPDWRLARAESTTLIHFRVPRTCL